jgi:hypothetical protein
MRTILAWIAYTAFFGQAFAEPNNYLAEYFEFPLASVTLDFDKSLVEGRARLIDGSVVPVSGINTRTGEMRLNFETTPPRVFEFSKEVDSTYIRWTVVGDEQGVLTRSRGGSVSESNLRLVPGGGCGAFYGSLELAFNDKSSSETLASALKDETFQNVSATMYLPEADNVVAEEDGSGQPHVSVADAIRYIADHTKAFSSFNVEIGSELSLMKAADKYGAFSLGLSSGGCGGGERIFFITDRAHLYEGGSFSDGRFKEFIRSNLAGFLDSSGFTAQGDHRLSEPVVSKLRVPPFSTHLLYKVVAPSEQSRGETGEWDRFAALFEPADLPYLAADEVGVVVTIEKLQSSKRSTGNSKAPDDAQFTEEMDWYEAFTKEAVITEKLFSWLVEKGQATGYRVEAEGL